MSYIYRNHRIMPVIVRASCNKAGWDKFEERRQVLENARSANVRRLRQDFDRISKRELEFAKNVLDTIVPVRLTWDEEAWARVKEFIPVRIEVQGEKEDKKEVVQAEIVDN